jgi:hypothetical protein
MTVPAPAPDSIWGDIHAGEVALLVAGVVLTLVMLGFLILVAIRAGRRDA